MSSPKYAVYMHTFKTSKKCYIGFTKFSVEDRLHKHYLNAQSGMDTKFYRAIRKYGIKDIETKILFESKDRDEACVKESEFIKKYDTFKTGYNSNLGGSGGMIIQILPKHHPKYIKWMKNRSENIKGLNNPTAFNVTNDQIIDHAVIYFKLNNTAPFGKKWNEYCFKNNIPSRYYARFRFGGKGISGMHEKLKIRLKKLKISYTKEQFERNYNDPEFKQKVSNTLKKLFKTEKGIEIRKQQDYARRMTFLKKKGLENVTN